MQAQTLGAALVGKLDRPSAIDCRMIEAVARTSGVSPLRQFAEILGLNRHDTALGPYEYHRYQVYRPDLSWTEKRSFVGRKGSTRLNLRLAPPGLSQMRGFLSDKLAFTGLMTHLGLPTTRVQAAFGTGRSFGALKTLRCEADIERFLTNEARFPLFGKPAQLQAGLGAVWIDTIDRRLGTARLGNGRTVGLRRLVSEIAGHATGGYLFQDVVDQHSDLVEMSGGRTLSTLRIVTVVAEADQPQVLYAVWRLPPPDAMIDDFWQDQSLMANVDIASGQLGHLRQGKGPETEWRTSHPVHGTPVTGRNLPFWNEAAALAVSAHAVVPASGILGWGIAIGPEGPVLIECNENTSHGIYQLATGRGLLNATFSAAFDKVDARNARMRAARKP
ncbi:MAG: hypothetical protein NTW20_05455 [Rhodobacterales bacterium]|nr:hypothetical protein [Rhodobacterales bacterium]